VKLPKGVLVALLTCPLPPQVEQVFGPVPGLAMNKLPNSFLFLNEAKKIWDQL